MVNSFSIVIPTVGSPLGLDRLLKSLATQSTSTCLREVVIVQNGSRSQATETYLLARMQRYWPETAMEKLRFVYEETPSLLAGRHRGVFETSGEIICFLDDDVTVGPNWMQTLGSAFRKTSVSIAGGPSRIGGDRTLPWWTRSFTYQTRHGGTLTPFLTLLDLGNEVVESVDPRLIWGLNFSIRRSVLQRLGGFNPDTTPREMQRFQGDGETGLARKAIEEGLRAYYSAELGVWHWLPDERLRLGFLFRRAFFEGVSLEFTRLRAKGEPRSWSSVPREEEFAPRHRELRDFALRWLAAFPRRAGRLYLRGWHIRSGTVRDWVSRPDYWDYAYPKEIKRGRSNSLPY